MKKRTKYIGNLIRKNIHETDPNAHVILYGSRARGKERPDSDWDILVLTDYAVNLQNERQFRNHLYELELEIGEPFSIFVYSKSEWENKQRITPFYMIVNKEGIRI